VLRVGPPASPGFPSVWGLQKGGKVDEFKGKIEKLIKEVLLNDKAQEEWIRNVDPDFLTAMETLIKRYTEDPSKTKAEIFRTGIMLGAVYEIWRQKNMQKGDR
jgi:hypothetical protein